MRIPVAKKNSRIASSITRVTGNVAAGLILPVEVLMKSPGLHGDHARRADIVIGDEFTGLENDLQMHGRRKVVSPRRFRRALLAYSPRRRPRDR